MGGEGGKKILGQVWVVSRYIGQTGIKVSSLSKGGKKGLVVLGTITLRIGGGGQRPEAETKRINYEKSRGIFGKTTPMWVGEKSFSGVFLGKGCKGWWGGERASRTTREEESSFGKIVFQFGGEERESRGCQGESSRKRAEIFIR